MRIFGISLGTIILVIAVAVIAKKWGSSIPLLKGIS